MAPAVAALRECAQGENRDPRSIGVQATLAVGPEDGKDTLRARLAHIRRAEPTHLTIDCRAAARSSNAYIEVSSAVAELTSHEL